MSKKAIKIAKSLLLTIMLLSLVLFAIACGNDEPPEEPITVDTIEFVRERSVDIDQYKSKIIQVRSDNVKGDLTWTADDSAVIKVESENYSDGLSAKVTGLKIGTTNLNVTDGSSTAKMQINVVRGKNPPTVIVENDDIVLFPEETYKLEPTFTFDGKQDDGKEFTFTPNDTNVIDLSADGIITAKANGTTTIDIKTIFSGDEIVKTVSITVLNMPTVVENKIGYFDSVYGAHQLKSENANFSYSESVVADGESGSLEISVFGTDGVFSGTFISLIQKDVSNSAYLTFKVYNPNDFDITVEVDDGIAATNCVSKEWTTVYILTKDLVKAEGLKAQSADITGLTINAYATEKSVTLTNGKLYLSSMFAKDKVEGRIGYFDEEFGQYQLTSTIANLTYTTDVALDGEQGSTMIEWTSEPVGNTITATIGTLVQEDVSACDYMVLNIYNPNSFDITFKFYIWYGRYVLKANTWTKIRFDVEDILKDEVSGGDPDITSLEDVTGMRMVFNAVDIYGELDESTEDPNDRIVVTDNVLLGAKVYLSTLTAYKNPVPEEVIEGRMGYFDEEFGQYQLSSDIAKFSYSTDVKYGDEQGSTAIEWTAEPTGVGIAATMTLVQNDFSNYDYLSFNVYNPNDFVINFKFYVWVANTELAANSWTTITVPLEQFLATSGVGDENITSLDDISAIKIRMIARGEGNTLTGKKVYLSAMNAYKSEENNIGNFNTPSGLSSLTKYSHKHDLSYSATVKYGNEQGSLKVTIDRYDANNIIAGHGIFAKFSTALINKDISKFDYLEFYIYSPNKDIAFKFRGNETDAGITAINKGEWRKYVINVSSLANLVTSTTDITTGLYLCIYNNASSTDKLEVGDEIYISAIKGYSIGANNIGGFDTERGANGLTPYSHLHGLSYDTGVKYGDEAGSLKVTISAYNATSVIAGQGVFAKIDSDFIHKDVSAYGYLEFYIYSPDKDITFKVRGKEINAGINTVEKGEWRRCTIDVSSLANLLDSTTDITGLQLCITNGGTDTLAVGDVIYISAIYGRTNAAN